MDPLSDVISLLKPNSYTCSGFDVGGDHSVQFPRFEGIKYYALICGQLWLLVDGVPDAVRLDAGDYVLLTGGNSCRLTTDLSLPATDVAVLKSMIRHNGDIVTLNGGGDSLTLGGHFLLSGLHANVLLDLLPPVIHIRKESVDPAFHWSLDFLMRELRTSGPGSSLVEQHLASLILIQALRVYLSGDSSTISGLRVRKCLQRCLQASNGMFPKTIYANSFQEPDRRRRQYYFGQTDGMIPLRRSRQTGCRFD